MPQRRLTFSALINRIPGRAYLLVSVIIFAFANSVTRRLTELGEVNLIDGRNPISFCNVLFVGNLCALVMLLLIYRKQFNPQLFQQLSKKDWISLIAVAILAGAMAPALFFIALDLTVVNNVVLIGRIELPLILALSVLLLGERLNSWVVIGAIISLLGIFLTVVLQPSVENMMPVGDFEIGRGELMALGGAFASALATIISKVSLQKIPLGLFSIVRTGIGTVVFFLVTIALYGSEHFADVLLPLLWQWMFIYGAVIVVGGQLTLFEGLKRSTAAEVSLSNSFSPIAGILGSFLILNEIPMHNQLIGGSVILLGIVLNQVGVNREKIRFFPSSQKNNQSTQDINVGYKGI